MPWSAAGTEDVNQSAQQQCQIAVWKEMRGNWVLSQERREKKGALHGSHGKVVTSWARRPKELRSCVASQHQAQRLPAAPSLQEPPASLAVGVTGDQCEVCVNGHGDDAEDQ